MKRFRLLVGSVLVCLCFPAASLFAQGGGGSLAGSVTDDANRPIVGALITASRDTLPVPSGRTIVPTNPSIVPFISGRAISGAKGVFQIGGLAAGSYSVCVQILGGGFVDDCEWAISSLTIDLKTGQAVGGLRVKLKRGAILQVRLNDLGKLLEQAPATSHVLMAVQTARGLWHPLSQVSKDATGTIHAVTVPFDTPVKFTISSPHVSLADGKGAALDSAGANVSLTLPSGTAFQPLRHLQAIPPGQPPQQLTFNVTGAK